MLVLGGCRCSALIMLCCLLVVPHCWRGVMSCCLHCNSLVGCNPHLNDTLVYFGVKATTVLLIDCGTSPGESPLLSRFPFRRCGAAPSTKHTTLWELHVAFPLVPRFLLGAEGKPRSAIDAGDLGKLLWWRGYIALRPPFSG